MIAFTPVLIFLDFLNLFGVWNLVLGICLEFGAWNLEFPRLYQ